MWYRFYFVRFMVSVKLFYMMMCYIGVLMGWFWLLWMNLVSVKVVDR